MGTNILFNKITENFLFRKYSSKAEFKQQVFKKNNRFIVKEISKKLAEYSIEGRFVIIPNHLVVFFLPKIGELNYPEFYSLLQQEKIHKRISGCTLDFIRG